MLIKLISSMTSNATRARVKVETGKLFQKRKKDKPKEAGKEIAQNRMSERVREKINRGNDFLALVALVSQ